MFIQWVPSHIIMGVKVPSDAVSEPLANTPLFETSRLETCPLTPLPIAAHSEPSQRATLLAVTPLTLVKAPPTYKLFPDAASAKIPPSAPLPNAVQFVPSHSAIEVI